MTKLTKTQNTVLEALKAGKGVSEIPEWNNSTRRALLARDLIRVEMYNTEFGRRGRYVA